MQPEQLDGLFERYVLTPPETRDGELVRMCDAHPRHANALRELVERYHDGSALIATTLALASTDRVSTLKAHLELIADRSTAYELPTLIARGGMALIQRAWDNRLRRTVARKLLPLDTPNVREFDERERRALMRFLDESHVQSSLQHPAILPVFDVGIENGYPFFTMPLVVGDHLGKAITSAHEHGLEAHALDRLVDILIRVCEAVSYAHAHGVIHRDLKPQNVMLGKFGETYVMDWGLAKLRPTHAESESFELDALRNRAEGNASMALQTMDGDVLGTPAYMAPEQAAGHIGKVDELSDLYAIGAMLYEALTAVPPYERSDCGSTPHAVLDAIQVAAPTPVHQVARGPLPASLVAICERAMARQPSERYASVAEFETDLRAFRDDRVVRAYRTGAIAELSSWIRRNRSIALVTACSALVVLVVSVVVAIREANANRTLEQSNADLIAARADANQRVEQLRRSRYFNDLATVQRLLESRQDFGRARQLLARCDQDLRGWEWRYLASLADQSERTILADEALHGLGFSPDGQLLAIGGRTQLTIHDLRAGTSRRFLGQRGRAVVCEFSPDGRHIGIGTEADELRVWDRRSGDLVLDVQKRHSYPCAIAFLTGPRVAAGGSDGVLRIWNHGQTKSLVANSKLGERITCMIFEPKTNVLVVGTPRQVIAFDEHGNRLWRAQVPEITIDLQVDTDQARVSYLSTKGDTRTWAIRDGEQLATASITLSPEGCTAAGFSPNQQLIVARAGSQALLVDRGTHRATGTFNGTGHEIYQVALSPDGTRIATSYGGREVKLWKTRGYANSHQRHDVAGTDTCAVDVDANGTWITAAQRNGRLTAIDLTDGALRFDINVGRRLNALDLSPDNSTIAVVGADRDALFFDVTGQRVGSSGAFAEGYLNSVCWFPDGSRLIAGPDYHGRIRVFGRTASDHNYGMRSPSRESWAAVSPDNLQLAVLTRSGRLQTWNIAPLQLVADALVANGGATRAVWSPDGKLIAVGVNATNMDDGAIVSVHEAQSLRRVHQLRGHRRFVQALTFGPDGRLFSAGSQFVRIWDPHVGIELLSLTLSKAGIARDMRVSANGRVLVVGGTRGVFTWVLGN